VPPGNQTNNYTYGKDGTPTGTGIAANSNGDITAFLAQMFTYNTRNQVAQDSNVNTPQNSQETFLYDPFGRRVNENYTGYGGSHVTNFLYDGSNVAQEQNSTAGRADVLNGLAMDDHFARTSGGVTMYFLTDALGSTRAIPIQLSDTQRRAALPAITLTNSRVGSWLTTRKAPSTTTARATWILSNFFGSCRATLWACRLGAT
jgi:hypothetical protein